MTATHKRIYSLKELEAMPTISASQFDDLKIDTGTVRVWLSRMTVDDGEPYDNKVTIELLKGGYKSATRNAYEKRGERGVWESPRWIIDYTYEAK